MEESEARRTQIIEHFFRHEKLLKDILDSQVVKKRGRENPNWGISPR